MGNPQNKLGDFYNGASLTLASWYPPSVPVSQCPPPPRLTFLLGCSTRQLGSKWSTSRLQLTGEKHNQEPAQWRQSIPLFGQTIAMRETFSLDSPFKKKYFFLQKSQIFKMWKRLLFSQFTCLIATFCSSIWKVQSGGQQMLGLDCEIGEETSSRPNIFEYRPNISEYRPIWFLIGQISMGAAWCVALVLLYLPVVKKDS